MADRPVDKMRAERATCRWRVSRWMGRSVVIVVLALAFLVLAAFVFIVPLITVIVVTAGRRRGCEISTRWCADGGHDLPIDESGRELEDARR